MRYAGIASLALGRALRPTATARRSAGLLPLIATPPTQERRPFGRRFVYFFFLSPLSCLGLRFSLLDLTWPLAMTGSFALEREGLPRFAISASRAYARASFTPRPRASRAALTMASASRPAWAYISSGLS